MTEILRERLNTLRTWCGADIQNDPSWIIRLARHEIIKLDPALRCVTAFGLDIPFTAAECRALVERGGIPENVGA